MAVADRRRDAAPAGPRSGQGRRGLPRRAGRRFDLDPAKQVRAYSKGNRQKVVLVAALMTRRGPAASRRADERPRPADGASLPRVCRMRRGSAGRRCSCPRTSSARSRPCATGSAILRAGELVEMGTLAEMRHLSSLTVEATFDGTVPDLSRVPGGQRGGGGGQQGPLPGDRLGRSAAERARRVRRASAAQPRALAGGAVPRPLRPGVGCGRGGVTCGLRPVPMTAAPRPSSP